MSQAPPLQSERKKHTLDATDMAIGRLASTAATLLRGKHKPTFAPQWDGGDFVHVTNLRSVRFSGTKLDRGMRYRHTGWPRGLRATPLREGWAKDPESIFRHAVRGMLPVNRHRPAMLKRLTIE